MAISEDKSGHLWLATGSGIFRWHKKTEILKQYYFDEILEDHPHGIRQRFWNNLFRYIHVDTNESVWAWLGKQALSTWRISLKFFKKSLGFRLVVLLDNFPLSSNFYIRCPLIIRCKKINSR